MASRTLVIGAVVVIVVIIAGVIALSVLSDNNGGGGGTTTDTYVFHSGDYLQYTISWSNGTVIGYWTLRVAQIIPEVQSITWNVTQNFNGTPSSWEVATDIHHMFGHWGEYPIGIIDETMLPGMEHSTVSLSTAFGTKNCDHWFVPGSSAEGYWYYRGVLMKYVVGNTGMGVYYVETLTDTTISILG